MSANAEQVFCQLAVDDVVRKISIKFPQYPKFASKFKTIIIEEAYEEIDILIEDVSAGFDESVILETLDEEIQIAQEDKDILCTNIHNILTSFTPPPQSLNLVDINVEVNKNELYSITQQVSKQVPLLRPYSSHDKTMPTIFGIAKKYNFPLVTYLIDMYQRYVIIHYFKLYQQLNKIIYQKRMTQFIAKKMSSGPHISDFFQQCYCMKQLRYKKLEQNDASAEKALLYYESCIRNFFRKAFIPISIMPNRVSSYAKIDDSMLVYTKYYISLLNAVNEILKDNKTQLPLQIDLWVIPKGISKAHINIDVDDSELDEDDSDEDDSLIGYIDDSESDDNEDDINNLEQRLKLTDNLVIKNIENQGMNALKNMFYQVYEHVVKAQKSKRMVIIIDRRKEVNHTTDKLYGFLPPNTQNIPSGNYLHECMLQLSRMEVLPSINGMENDRIGAYFDKICMLSVHIHSEDIVRAYWFINSGHTRWFMNDIIQLWPLYFVEKGLFQISETKSEILIFGYVKTYCKVVMPYDIIDIIGCFYPMIDVRHFDYQDVEAVINLVKDYSKAIPLRDDNFDKFFEINTRIKPEETYCCEIKKRKHEIIQNRYGDNKFYWLNLLMNFIDSVEFKC